MTGSIDRDAAAIALNRFGLGVRPDEPLPQDARAFLREQFQRYVARPPAWAGQPGSGGLVVGYVEYLRGLRQADTGSEPAKRQQAKAEMRERYRSSVAARVAAALDSPAPFAERLVHFWANHFAVSVDKIPLAALAGAYEAEAIRPHVFGRFEDMLLAVERHPAMLLYLDQARSIGPGSPALVRAASFGRVPARGLNENLAREILELHTLGVRTGYGQEDVGELARAMTGWTIGGLPGRFHTRTDGAVPGGFVFRPELHEPGPRKVLGRRYDQPGETQAEAILRDLASASATAQHIARKLAVHFVSDTPPQRLVDRLADTFRASGGDLPSVYEALIDSPEPWRVQQTKFKTPWDWALSCFRALGWRDLKGEQLAPMLTLLGQPVWRPGSPAGYDDSAESWAAPDALMRRVELAQRFASKARSTIDARALGPQLVPHGLSESTIKAIGRAESAATALTLLLASPEFLRR
jgi:uncharacterized protein (DUF1800 family)